MRLAASPLIAMLILAGCAAPDRSARLEAAQQARATAQVTAVLYFAAGSAAVPAAEMGKLRAVADYIARHPGAHVAITGYADATGAAKVNRALSRSRANAAYDALLAHGMPEATLVAVIGAGAPAAATDAAPADRRVVIEIRGAS